MTKPPQKNLSDLCAAAKQLMDQSDLENVHVDVKSQEDAVNRAKLFAEIRRRLEGFENDAPADQSGIHDF